jgi:hypothetical protein
VRVPAADHPPGSLRPVHFVSGYFPRLVDSARSPGYAPSPEAPSPSQPLGYIPQVAHTYAYWDLNYGAPRYPQERGNCKALGAHSHFVFRPRSPGE